MIAKNVIFYGPLGISKNKIGGGEAGNRKTVEILIQANFGVTVIEKPYLISNPIFRILVAPFQYVGKYHKFLLEIVKNKKTLRLFHLSGFYNNLILLELIFIFLAKINKLKVIYEIRAGGMIDAYQKRSPFYRYLFKKVIHNSNLILCQGQSYCDFLKERFEINSIYYPNFVRNSFFLITNQTTERMNSNLIEIIYTGRLTPSKRINKIVEIGVKMKINKSNFIINIIGDGDEKYIDSIKEMVYQNNLSNVVLFHGPKSEIQIAKILSTQHFFIFPTEEAREGHSNSLTEAMSFGVVPIASPNGFNKTIIDKEELIIKSGNSDDYVETIKRIADDRASWKYYSDFVHSRVCRFYTQKIVAKKLRNAYDSLLE